MNARLPVSLVVVIGLLLTFLAAPARPVAGNSICDTAPLGLIGYARSVDGDALGIDLQGQYVYLADWSGALQVFDVGDPCAPVRLPGHVRNPWNEIGDLDVAGSYAYVAADANGLAVYDISNPAAPTFVAGRSDSSYAHSIFFDDARYAYTGYIYGYGRELVIYDMADASGTLDVAGFPARAPVIYGPPAPSKDIFDVTVVGDRAYVYDGDGAGAYRLLVLDVSDRSSPQLLGAVSLPYTQYGNVTELRVQGDYVYLATGDHSAHDGGLIVVHVANPAAPTIVATHFLAASGAVPWKGGGLDVAGDRAYLMGQDGLYVFDISVPASPSLLTIYPFPTDFGRVLGGHVVVRDNLAFAAVYRHWPDTTTGHGGLAIYKLFEANQPPTAITLAPDAIAENQPAGTIVGLLSAVDPDAGDSHSFSLVSGAGDTYNGAFTLDGAQLVALQPFDFEAGAALAVRVRATDAGGLSFEQPLTVAVTNRNEAPALGPISGPSDPIPVGTTVELRAALSDPDAGDTHAALWDWGDGTSSAGTLAPEGVGFSVSGDHAYTAPGIYTVVLLVTDGGGLTATETYHYVVSYDSGAGFVTGGGWFVSPAGAYAPDSALADRATFGVVARYQQGATVPSGSARFQLHGTDLSFRSSSYDWLVITGARAQVKGEGTLNDGGSYGFLLTAIDGRLIDDGAADRFRITIWDLASGNVVYDNQRGAGDAADAATELMGGSIVIHGAR